MIKNRIFALIWRVIGAALGIMGLVFQWKSGLGFMHSSMLVFFTVQTNIFTTVLFGILAAMTAVQLIKKQGNRGDAAHIPYSAQLAFTFYITITFAVYWTLLSWQNYGNIGGGVNAAMSIASNYILHGVVPLWAIGDWIMFMPHGKIKRSKLNAAIWLSYPLLYFIFVAIRAAVGGPLYTLGGVDMYYPYVFLEPAILGSAWLLIPVVLALSLAFWGSGILYIFCDKKLGKAYDKKHPAESGEDANDAIAEIE